MSPTGGSGGGTMATPGRSYRSAPSGPPAVEVLLLAGAVVGLWFFSQGVRMIDIAGLFASGVLAGVAITRWLR